MMRFWRKNAVPAEQKVLVSSRLFNEETFYNQFVSDLEEAKDEVVIESPFISTERMNMIYPVLKRLFMKNVKIYIVTRDPLEHNEEFAKQAEHSIRQFEILGIQVLLCPKNHHRKLAIIDRSILWEGSLNILSQIYSKELMRRLEGGVFAQEMIDFLHLEKYLN